jgi:catechol 2,3-dioxygenase-like lactoylglutathione lyase family enzyme
MAKVTGIGGVFFRSRDPKALQDWYVEHLGLSPDHDGYVVIEWGGDQEGSTVWAPFAEGDSYFGSDDAQWMVNYRVDDLEGLLARLGSEGVRVEAETTKDDNGVFGWCWDLEGNKVELWQPTPGM